MSLTDQEIKTAMNQYQARKEYQKKRYDQTKDNPEFREKNCRRVTEWYKNGGNQIKAGYYLKNQERSRLVSHMCYYKKNGRMREYKNTFPERYQRIMDINPLLIPPEADWTLLLS